MANEHTNSCAPVPNQATSTLVNGKDGGKGMECPNFSTEEVLLYLYGKSKAMVIDIEQEKAIEKVKTEKVCSACGIKSIRCPFHDAPSSSSSNETADRWLTYAIQSFPAEVQLSTSTIPGARYGVCAKRTIPEGTWIGPFEGKRRKMEELEECKDTAHAWEVYEEGQPSCYIDGSDENTSSWMRFIRCARHPSEQNLYAFQYLGNIFYRSFKEISEGTEMLVWYDDKYPQYMGIPTGLQEIEFVNTAGIPSAGIHNNDNNNNNEVMTKTVDGGINGKSPNYHTHAHNNHNHGQHPIQAVEDKSPPQQQDAPQHPPYHRRDQHFHISSQPPTIYPIHTANQQPPPHMVANGNGDVMMPQAFPPQLGRINPPQAVVKPVHNVTQLRDGHLMPMRDGHVTSLRDGHVTGLRDGHDVMPLHDGHMPPLRHRNVTPLRDRALSHDGHMTPLRDRPLSHDGHMAGSMAPLRDVHAATLRDGNSTPAAVNISAGVPPQNMMGNVTGRVYRRSRDTPVMHGASRRGSQGEVPGLAQSVHAVPAVPQMTTIAKVPSTYVRESMVGPQRLGRGRAHAHRSYNGFGRHAGLPPSPYSRGKEAMTRRYSSLQSHSVDNLLAKPPVSSFQTTPLSPEGAVTEHHFNYSPPNRSQVSPHSLEVSGVQLSLRQSPSTTFSSQHSLMVSSVPSPLNHLPVPKTVSPLPSMQHSSAERSLSVSPRRETQLLSRHSSSSSGGSSGHAHEELDGDSGSTGSKDENGSLVDEISMWRCKQCQKTFTQRVLLQVHVCPRQPNKPYQCGQCELSFGSSRELRNHVDTHASEKPFKCGFCSRSFAGATTLNNHIRTHMGKRPFSCERCGKNFSQAGQLARHHRTPEDCDPPTPSRTL